jgi:hypothetical protein
MYKLPLTFANEGTDLLPVQAAHIVPGQSPTGCSGTPSCMRGLVLVNHAYKKTGRRPPQSVGQAIDNRLTGKWILWFQEGVHAPSPLADKLKQNSPWAHAEALSFVLLQFTQ